MSEEEEKRQLTVLLINDHFGTMACALKKAGDEVVSISTSESSMYYYELMDEVRVFHGADKAPHALEFGGVLNRKFDMLFFNMHGLDAETLARFNVQLLRYKDRIDMDIICLYVPHHIMVKKDPQKAGSWLYNNLLEFYKMSGYEISFNMYDMRFFGIPTNAEGVVIYMHCLEDYGAISHIPATHHPEGENGLPKTPTLRSILNDFDFEYKSGIDYNPLLENELESLESADKWSPLYRREDYWNATQKRSAVHMAGVHPFKPRLIAWQEGMGIMGMKREDYLEIAKLPEFFKILRCTIPPRFASMIIENVRGFYMGFDLPGDVSLPTSTRPHINHKEFNKKYQGKRHKYSWCDEYAERRRLKRQALRSASASPSASESVEE